MMKLAIRLSMILLLATTFLGGVASAQSYPTKPIKYIVPFPPGGPLDVLSRILTPYLSESLGQPVVVENIAGANASIGLDREIGRASCRERVFRSV